jgi:hypothetical protein
MSEQGQWMNDEQIAAQYRDFRVTETKRWSKDSGGMQIEFPNYEDRWDNFMRYDDGRIAFDQWYPPEVYAKLCEKAREVLAVPLPLCRACNKPMAEGQGYEHPGCALEIPKSYYGYKVGDYVTLKVSLMDEESNCVAAGTVMRIHRMAPKIEVSRAAVSTDPERYDLRYYFAVLVEPGSGERAYPKTRTHFVALRAPTKDELTQALRTLEAKIIL